MSRGTEESHGRFPLFLCERLGDLELVASRGRLRIYCTGPRSGRTNNGDTWAPDTTGSAARVDRR